MRVVAVVLLVVLAAGCLGPIGRQPAECPSPARGAVLHPGIWPTAFNAGEPSDLLYLAQLDGDVRLVVNATDGNETYSQPLGVFGDGKPVPVEDLRFTPEAGERHFGAVRVAPGPAEAGVVLNFRFRALDPACPVQGGLTINWGPRPEASGVAAQPGQGAHVWYAGFWENGTLFDTNLKELDVGSGWPKAGWYEGGHWDPIPVYVYDQDRSEQPAYWKGASGNAAGAPPEADPLDPIVGTAAGAADTTAGLGYFTTIKGFNEAVKGLPVGTRQVFRLAPEDAYTQPGREDHLLYGDALVFLVEVQAVVDAPCPATATGPCAEVPSR